MVWPQNRPREGNLLRIRDTFGFVSLRDIQPDKLSGSRDWNLNLHDGITCIRIGIDLSNGEIRQACPVLQIRGCLHGEGDSGCQGILAEGECKISAGADVKDWQRGAIGSGHGPCRVDVVEIFEQVGNAVTLRGRRRPADQWFGQLRGGKESRLPFPLTDTHWRTDGDWTERGLCLGDGVGYSNCLVAGGIEREIECARSGSQGALVWQNGRSVGATELKCVGAPNDGIGKLIQRSDIELDRRSSRSARGAGDIE